MLHSEKMTKKGEQQNLRQDRRKVKEVKRQQRRLSLKLMLAT